MTTYSSTVLFNFRRIDPSKPISMENVWTLATSTGSVDESWFFVVSLGIEAESGNLLRTGFELDAQLKTDPTLPSAVRLMDQFTLLIDRMAGILVRMYEECMPMVFYHRIHRYLGGWRNSSDLPRGLFYGDDEEPRQLAGASAAQSPVIQVIDIVLGVKHGHHDADTDTFVGSSGTYLLEMREFMTREHRECLQWLEGHMRVRENILASPPNSPIRVSYQNALNALRRLRDKHLQIVTNYVVIPARKTDGQAEIHGTGGSNPIPFLKEVRDHVTEAAIQ